MAIDGWLVGIRADSRRTARKVGRLLESYVIPSDDRARSNFSVRGQSRLRRRSAQLYVAGTLVTEGSDRMVLDRLAAYLACVPSHTASPLSESVRLYARDDTVVLSGLPNASAPDPLVLSEAGIVELPVLRPTVTSSDRSVEVPGALTDRQASRSAARYRIAGILTHSQGASRHTLKQLTSNEGLTQADWLELLEQLTTEAKIRPVADRNEAQSALLDLLECR